MKRILLLSLLLLLLSGCTAPAPVPIPTLATTSTNTPQPTATTSPTQTKVPTQTETPKPTEVDYSQAFFDPQSEADFPKVIESPSPLDDPTDYSPWEDGYLAAVDKFLVDYTGPFIESDTPESYAPDPRIILFKKVKVMPIASYRFPWIVPDGTSKTIITKTFPIRDKVTGVKGSFSLTYSVDKRFNYETPVGDLGEYGTPTVEAPLGFFYAVDSISKGNFPFNEEFLPADGNKALVMMGNFVLGKGIDPDLNKQRFVFGGYK